VSRLAGVFAPQRQGAPTPERLVEALGASAQSAAAGPAAVGWTAGASVQTSPALAVTAGGAVLDSTAGLETGSARAAFRWNVETGEGFLAVDPLGAASLFLHGNGARLTFATELIDLLRLIPVRPAPNRGAVISWLADGSVPRGETLYEGIQRLPGGHVVRLGNRGWRTERYWSPRYAGVADGSPAEQETRVLEAVVDAVDRAATHASRAGILLSGGLDSTTIAAIASRQRTLHSYSAVYPDYPEVDEAETIDVLTRQLGLEACSVPIRVVSMVATADEYIRNWALPPASPLLALQRPLLERVRDGGVDVLLDGQGGDELFGASPYLIADSLRRGRMRTAAHLARLLLPEGDLSRTLLDLGVKGNLPRQAHRAARSLRPRTYAPQWLRPAAARIYLEERDQWSWKALDGPRWWAFLADQLTAERERAGVHDYLRHKSVAAAAVGRHPFLQDVELIRVVLSLPPELAFDAVYDRPLLRRSMAGVVPDDVRLKTEKPHFTRLFVDAMGETDFDVAAELLGGVAEVHAYVRPEAVARILQATPQERRVYTWAWTLWRLAVCERWLQSQTTRD